MTNTLGIDTERHFIGGLVIDPEAVYEVYDIIEPDMLEIVLHRKIYKAIYDLYTAGKHIDIVTVCHQDPTISTYDLLELSKEVYTSANIRHHALLVRNEWAKKEAEKIKSEKLDGEANEAISVQIEKLQDLLIKVEPDKLMADLIHRTIDELEAIRAGAKFFFKTGVTKLDERLGGLAGGEYHIIAARPGVGKTSLALSILLNNLMTEDLPAIFISGEMADKQIITRLTSMYLNIPMYQLKTGDYDKEQWQQIQEFLYLVKKSNLVVQQISAITPGRFKILCKKLHKKYKPKIIILDYIQKVTAYKGSRNEDISQMSQAISDISKELDVPMVILAQINRQTMNLHEEPDLHHLRDSGSLEQDCDTAIFIYTRKQDGITRTELLVQKNRNGPVGRFDVNFNTNRVLFHNIEGQPEYLQKDLNPF